MPDKSTMARIEANLKRLKRLDLRVWNVHISERLYRAFKRQAARDRLTLRQIGTALIDFYVQGGFKIEKETDQADKK